ncbi:nuclear transport factor 2 family protein [Marinifilum sp. RC60d5]|uniref:nuclear transport factor 2 family protein n=1 Tax=Marinifilum sp. RC60d5 TaxID=3458414 RepID=UPI004035AE73
MPKFFLLYLVSVFLLFSSCKNNKTEKESIVTNLIDNWHKDAASANLDDYFKAMSEDAIYIGTDPSEKWTKEEFYQFCKPFFDKGTTWNFTPFDRKIYYSSDTNTIWFDELLNTWMGVCRGSGVIVVENGNYKISHYHLSVTIKNESMQEFLQVKQN